MALEGPSSVFLRKSKESRDVLWGLIWSSGVLLGTNLLRILGGLKEVLRSPTS